MKNKSKKTSFKQIVDSTYENDQVKIAEPEKKSPHKKSKNQGPAHGVKSIYETDENHYLERKRGIKNPAQTMGNRK